MRYGISDKGLRRIAQSFQVNASNLSSFEQELLDMSLEDFIENKADALYWGYWYDADLPNEANANNPEWITLGSKFFDLDFEARAHVLAHEKAHRIFDNLESSKEGFWDEVFNLADEGAFGPKDEEGQISQGINGQVTPMENLVEGLTLYYEEPDWLIVNYSQVYEYIQNLDKEGLLQ